MAGEFVHLRVKSAYSLLEGAIRPGELAALAAANQMPAVAVTDVNNLFGVFEISESLAKKGVQFSEVKEERWGSITQMQLPGGGRLGLYQPRHPTALNLGGE